jgi:uncharacterized oligopeptide transporter (OPT) family protein
LSFRFFFDFPPTYCGVVMICPYIMNVSLLLGGILFWGIMWPLSAKKTGVCTQHILDTQVYVDRLTE